MLYESVFAFYEKIEKKTHKKSYHYFLVENIMSITYKIIIFSAGRVIFFRFKHWTISEVNVAVAM